MQTLKKSKVSFLGVPYQIKPNDNVMKQVKAAYSESKQEQSEEKIKVTAED